MAPACDLIDGVAAENVIADKAYDADHLHQILRRIGAEPVISPRPDRAIKHPCDARLYKERNGVERMFARLKQFRRVATRYDKLADNFLAGVLIAATISYWAK